MDEARTIVPIITCDALTATGLRHAFFTRGGGVSEGVYTSLNGGTGSGDAAGAVTENRARMARALGLAPDRLLVPFQVHSPDAVSVSAPWAVDQRPRADAIVTATDGLGVGVTGADCGIVLLVDPTARVIGAAHAGWKGALTGIIEATLAAMEKLGAERDRICAALGPTIGPSSYEVGSEFVARFTTDARDNAHFFTPSTKPGHSFFDLPSYIGMRARQAGCGHFINLGLDTYTDEARFFSYRRSVHRKEPDYGRLIAAIALLGPG
jgi:YfiH family protein